MQIINIYKEENKVNGIELDKIGKCFLSRKILLCVYWRGFLIYLLLGLFQ